MKRLLMVTAWAEAATGLALVLSPSVPASMLFGASLDTPTELVFARIAGGALLSIGAACWLSRNEEKSRAATGLVAALSLYNAAAIAILVHAGLSLGLSGIGLWPAVVLHVGLAGWCISCLLNRRVSQTSKQANQQ